MNQVMKNNFGGNCINTLIVLPKTAISLHVAIVTGNLCIFNVNFIFRVATVESSDSDSIQFEKDGSTDSPETEISVDSKTNSKGTAKTDQPVRNIREIQFMYIQMEFCEKSTLRNAIDNGLYLEEDRVWRLFREIVEGM